MNTVLRLPVAHCELNPIELAWASVKGYAAKHNIAWYRLEDMERLTPEVFAHTTTDMWRNFCRRVVKVENDYIVKDRVVEDIVEEMMVTIIIPDSDDDSDD